MRLVLAHAAVMVSLSIAGSTRADVPRYQTATQELVIRLSLDPSDDRLHTFQIVLNPCDGTFEGTGVSYQSFAGPEGVSETISGTYDGSVLTFVATYGPETPIYPNYWWRLNADGTTADSLGYVNFPIYFDFGPPLLSQYRNHGQYIKLNGGVDDAAHSCLGMPLVSEQGM